MVVHQPPVEQASAIITGHSGGRGLDSDRREARVGHAAHGGAADDPGDAYHGLRRGSVADPGNGEDRADADYRIRRREQHEIRIADRLEHAGRRSGLRRAYRQDRLRRDRGVQPDPPLLEVDDSRRWGSATWRVGARLGVAREGDVRLNPVVGHRQQADAWLPAITEDSRDLGQGLARGEQLSAQDVRGEVPVAKGEPGRARAIGGQLVANGEGLVGSTPALLGVDAAAEGVHDGV